MCFVYCKIKMKCKVKSGEKKRKASINLQIYYDKCVTDKNPQFYFCVWHHDIVEEILKNVTYNYFCLKCNKTNLYRVNCLKFSIRAFYSLKKSITLVRKQNYNCWEKTAVTKEDCIACHKTSTAFQQKFYKK